MAGGGVTGAPWARFKPICITPIIALNTLLSLAFLSFFTSILVVFLFCFYFGEYCNFMVCNKKGRFKNGKRGRAFLPILPEMFKGERTDERIVFIRRSLLPS